MVLTIIKEGAKKKSGSPNKPSVKYKGNWFASKKIRKIVQNQGRIKE